MLLQKDKTNPHFNGKGEVIRLFYKLDNNTPKRIISALKKLVIKEVKKMQKGKNPVNMRINLDLLNELARKFNLVNEEGRITALAPRTIIIKDGEEKFKESSIIADTIIQKGGIFKGKIEGGEIWVFGGKNDGIHTNKAYRQFGKYNPKVGGDIKAKELYAYDTELHNNLSINYDINLFNTSKIVSPEGKKIKVFSKKGTLTMSGKAKIEENVDASVQSLKVSGSPEINGKVKLRKGMLDLGGEAKIGTTGIVTTRSSAVMREKAESDGTLTGSGLTMLNESKIRENGKVTTKESIHMKDKTENHGSITSKKESCNLGNNCIIGPTGHVDAEKNIIANGDTEVSGTLKANKGEVRLCDRVSASKTASIYNNAIKLYDSAEFFGTTYTNNPVIVSEKTVFKPIAQNPLIKTPLNNMKI